MSELLSLSHARVAAQESCFLQDASKFRIEVNKRAGDP